MKNTEKRNNLIEELVREVKALERDYKQITILSRTKKNAMFAEHIKVLCMATDKSLVEARVIVEEALKVQNNGEEVKRKEIRELEKNLSSVRKGRGSMKDIRGVLRSI